MMFDALAKVVERSAPQFRGAMDRARLFSIQEEAPQGARELRFHGDPETDVVENYRIPFDVVAVDETDGTGKRSSRVSLLWERPDRRLGFVAAHRAERHEGILVVSGKVEPFPGGSWGMRTKGGTPLIGELHGIVTLATYDRRGFVKDEPIKLSAADVMKHVHDYEPGEGKGEVHSMVDAIERRRDPSDLMSKAREKYGAVPDRELKQRIHSDMLSELNLANAALGNLALQGGLLDLLDICDPSRFIVEETPFQGLRRPRKGTIARSPWRPHYVVLKPKEIRRRLIPLEKGHSTGKRAPHERRGHYRRYPDDPVRYPNAHGQLKWIRASWVGPREAIVGRTKYRVHLGEEFESASSSRSAASEED